MSIKSYSMIANYVFQRKQNGKILNGKDGRQLPNCRFWFDSIFVNMKFTIFERNAKKNLLAREMKYSFHFSRVVKQKNEKENINDKGIWK